MAMKNTMYRILIVCLGNLCRSPMAEGVLRTLLHKHGLEREFSVGSAGTRAHHHAGQRPDPRAVEVAARRGYSGIDKQRARAITQKDFEKFDCIVAMDSSNLAYLQKICPPEFQRKLHLLLEYAPRQNLLDVPDPYYGGLAGFERVLDLCEAGVAGLLDSCLRHRTPPPQRP